MPVHDLSERVHRQLSFPPAVGMVRCIRNTAQKSNFCSEFVNRLMSLFSASEDLAIRTLRSIRGALQRLRYLASLRQSDGSYRHWGLEWLHGEGECDGAVRDAHRDVLSEILRRPLPELWNEVLQEDSTPLRQTEEIEQSFPKLLPSACSPAAQSHLSAILLALIELAKTREQTSSRPAA